jgi:serine/threonine protein kinase
MGEVYKAKDTRLGRDVAIKVLPASFSADADRLRRFEQKAKAAGLLNSRKKVSDPRFICAKQTPQGVNTVVG